MPLDIPPNREGPEDLDRLRLHDVGAYNLTVTRGG
jgi:hypothetical protein